MVDSVNAIGNNDYFAKTDLPEKYDFNKDGKVDIADYNIAASALSDKDTEKYEGLTKTQLDEAFKTLLEKSGSAADTEITEENANETAKQIIEEIKSGALNPKNATSLNHLQEIGRTLSAYIKQCAVLKQTLADKIEKEKAELEEIAEERKVKEAEYADKEAEVNAKTAELSQKMVAVLNESNRLSQAQQTKADTIIRECVRDYKDGKYPNTALTEVIATQLGKTGDGYKVAALRSLLKGTSDLSNEIKSICSSIDGLVADIKAVNEKYNAKNAAMNSDIDVRNAIIEASTTASQQYQAGYQQRIDMRQAIHDTYYVEGNGDVTSKNEQVQKLNDFLTNKELDKMPFADAWEILNTTFDNCGIKYSKDGKISIPKGHDATSKNVYSELVNAIQRNYSGIEVSQYEEEFEGGGGATGGVTEVTAIKRTDPISFTVGNAKYEFINDNNNNGTFDNASEFLGASRGWEEMKAFDTDGDGFVSGDELKELKLVSVNQSNGQYTFMTAEEAGIASINLNSYKGINTTEINNNITVGSFDIKMDDGSTIKGTQTEDTMKNMANTYSNLFGSDIGDLSETYETNPFMEDFVERVNTTAIATTATENVNKNSEESDRIIDLSDKKIDRQVANESIKAMAEKRIADDIKAREQEKAEEKQKAKEEEKQAEEKQKAKEEEKANKK